MNGRLSLAIGAALAAVAALGLAGCGKSEPTPPAATAAPAAPAATATSIGTEIDDTVLTTKIKSALLSDPEIKSFDIKVETRKGEVQLSGFVSTQAQIDLAIKTAQQTVGVTRVESGIQIKEGIATIGNTVDDGIITTGVKSALLADPDVKSFDIAVVTRKGEVQLSGFVNNQAQMDRAVKVAGGVSGVSRVGNEMSIKQ